MNYAKSLRCNIERAVNVDQVTLTRVELRVSTNKVKSFHSISFIVLSSSTLINLAIYAFLARLSIGSCLINHQSKYQLAKRGGKSNFNDGCLDSTLFVDTLVAAHKTNSIYTLMPFAVQNYHRMSLPKIFYILHGIDSLSLTYILN